MDYHFFLESRHIDFLHASIDGPRWISFLNCIAVGAETLYVRPEGRTHRVHLYAHFAIIGPRPITLGSQITRIGVVVDDFANIYDDFDAFGIDVAPEKHITAILKAFQEKIGRQIETGDQPIIAYFAGRPQLLSAQAPFGRVTASHRPSYGMGELRGISIHNNVWTNLEFDPSVTFENAINNLMTVLRFLELIAGRRQNIQEIDLELDAPAPSYFKVYWPEPPKRATSLDDRTPHPMDMPLNGGIRPTEFARVLEGWLALDQMRADARAQFSDGFSKSNHYDVARLVSSANMFDILPSTVFPLNVNLPEDLQKAKAETQRIFKSLPQSSERDSILSALGRLGSPSLKRKVRHRGEVILTAVPKAYARGFPDLLLVLDEAVNCRNHYVHGSPAKIDYHGLLPFLIDTLEFVFGASDLIDAGWEIGGWIGRTTGSHPFGSYCASYLHNMQRLQEALQQPQEPQSNC